MPPPSRLAQYPPGFAEAIERALTSSAPVRIVCASVPRQTMRNHFYGFLRACRRENRPELADAVYLANDKTDPTVLLVCPGIIPPLPQTSKIPFGVPIMANDLLTEIEESHHEALLREGNLRAAKVREIIRWQPAGNIARVQKWSCTCGASGTILTGIFSREVSLDGTASRERAFPLTEPIPYIPSDSPVEVTFSRPQTACPACISQKGFSEFPL